MTQLQAARSGVVTEAMRIVAADEEVDAETVRAAVASGTDIAPGYDHVVSSIGATAAATYDASLLSTVTPAEHLTSCRIRKLAERMKGEGK